MAYEDNNKTYVRETTRTTESSGTSMALIVGGLVVAVAFILWLAFGGTTSEPVPTTVPASDTTNVTIEPPAAPADTNTDVTVDPAPAVTPDAVEPAAPVDGAADPVVDPDAAPAETAPADNN